MADDVRRRRATHSFTFTVTPGDFRLPTILSPQTPISVDRGRRLTDRRDDGYFGDARARRRSGPYTVDRAGRRQRQRTRAAQRGGPARGRRRLPATRSRRSTCGVADGHARPGTLRARGQDPGRGQSDAPYRPRRPDRRGAPVVDDYTTTPTSATLPCAGSRTVECFATFKRGFCQYYAATMAVILRDLGVPTRIAAGLPARRRATHGRGIETILFSNAHAWVEVYFPGYGWVPSTRPARRRPSSRRCRPDRPAGKRAPRPSAARRPPRIPRRRESRRSPDPGSIGPAGRSRRGPLGPLRRRPGLLLARSSVASRSWPGSAGRAAPTSADGAYGTVTRIASRFGFGPRPTQTVYEYAGVARRGPAESGRSSRRSPGPRSRSAYGREILGDERLAEPQGGPAPAAGEPPAARLPPQGATPPAADRGRWR